MTEHNLDTAGYEREVADTDEAKQLRWAIYNALSDYADYLDRCGLIWDLTKIDSNGDFLKVESLVAEIDFCTGESFKTMLKGGALDPEPHDVSVPVYKLRALLKRANRA